MKQYVIVAIAGVTLASIAAVGVFASEPIGALVGEETPTDTATPETTETPTDATETPETTATPEDATPTPEVTGTPEDATPTPEDATPTPEATGTSEPEPTGTPGDDDDGGDVRGIPDSNPVWGDDDGDGECEKGETKIKTTPSGNQVRVPCHAGKDDDDGEEGESSGTSDEDAGHGHGHGHGN